MVIREEVEKFLLGLVGDEAQASSRSATRFAVLKKLPNASGTLSGG